MQHLKKNHGKRWQAADLYEDGIQKLSLRCDKFRNTGGNKV